MKKINYLLIALIAMVGSVFTSCSDDETNLSRAVLASVDVLQVKAVHHVDDDPLIITITSDADWVSVTPDWITVVPATGHAGKTDVELIIADNIRDGLEDNPRKATVIFKGRNLWSEAPVIIRQDGDKFRDPEDFTINDMEAAEDETVVRLPNMIVTAYGSEGFICTDGDQYAYVTKPTMSVEIGKKVSIVGEKWTNDKGLAYVKGERMTDEGTAVVPVKTPVDITSTLDKTNGKTYQYVTITGDFDGSAITVADNNCKGYIVNANDDLGFSKLAGHKVKVTGYYAGQAAPVVNIIPSEVEDLGVNEVIYFYDDFEWMDPWCVIANASDYVKNSESIEAESINLKGKDENGKMLIDEFYDRGYNFVKATYPGKDDRPFETRIYMQRNYVKFSLTGIEAGVILPKLENIPDGESLELSFDWSPMRQGKPGETGRNYDDIHLIVIVENNGSEQQIEVPAHTLVTDGPHEWMHPVIDLSNYTIDANTKITIRSSDDKWPHNKVNRWFFDNVKVRQKK